MSRPVIIEVAVNGPTRKDQQGQVPISVDELISDGLDCLAAGASIFHHHDDFRTFADKEPMSMARRSAEVFTELQCQFPRALMYPTANAYHLGDGTKMWQHHEHLNEMGLIDMALLDPGATLLWRPTESGAPGSGILYGYTPRDIANINERCRALRLAPSIACFEPGYIRLIASYARAGALAAGAFVKFYFGTDRQPFGLPPSTAALDLYLDVLTGTGLPWACATLGGDIVQSGFAEEVLARGGHLRIGLEDFESDRQVSNLELLTEAIDLVKKCGNHVANHDETRQILGIR